jgi:hypothetical protein
VNHKRIYKLYNGLGLQLRNKTPKRRVKAKLREDRRRAIRPNEVRAMDFLHDQLATGRKIRVLTVVDTFSRFSPVLAARFSYRGEDVVQTLERVCSQIGYPKAIRVDQDRVRLPRPRSVGLHEGRHARLLPAGEADRQCLRRGIQQPGQGRVNERALVPVACRGPRKDGGLAQMLQRASPTWGDRPEAANFVAQSRGRSQPATVIRSGNSAFRCSKEWLRFIPTRHSGLRLMKEGGHVIVSQKSKVAEAIRYTLCAPAHAQGMWSSYLVSRPMINWLKLLLRSSI